MRKLKLLSMLCLFLCSGATAWANVNPTTLTRLKVVDNTQIKAGATYVFDNNAPSIDGAVRYLDHNGNNLWNGAVTESGYFRWTLEANPDNSKQFALKSGTDGTNKYIGITKVNTNVQMQATPYYFEFDKIEVDGVVAGFALKDPLNGTNGKWLTTNTTWYTEYTETRPITINDPAVWTMYEVISDATVAIDRTNWGLTCSTWSKDGVNETTNPNGGEISTITDGNSSTYWHSAYNDSGSGPGTSSLGCPQWFLIDMESEKHIVEFGYTRRDGGGNGSCTQYKIYVSNDPINLTTPMTATTKSEVDNLGINPVQIGTLPNNTDAEQKVLLTTPTKGRYVLFVITGGTSNFASCAEFNLYTYADARQRDLLLISIYEATVLKDKTPVGTQIGAVSETSKETFGGAITTAPSVYDNTASTEADYKNAIAALATAVEDFKSAINKIADGGIYMLVNAEPSLPVVTMFSDFSAKDLKWERRGNNPITVSNKYYWRLTADYNRFKVQNGDGTYIYAPGTGNAKSDIKMTTNAAEATPTAFTQYQYDLWNIIIGDRGNNYAHPAGHEESDWLSGEIMAANVDQGSTSAWRIHPVSSCDVYDVVMVGVEDATVTHSSSGDQAVNGGFFVFATGTTVEKSAFTLSDAPEGYLAGEVLEITAPADGNHGTIKVVYRRKFAPVADGAYLIKNINSNRYAYREAADVYENINAVATSTSYDYRSFFKISGSYEEGYTIRLANDESQYVYWMNKDNNKLNVAVKTVEGTPDDNCKWDIYEQPTVGSGGWNIKPHRGDNGWNIFGQKDNHIGSWWENDKENNVWTIENATNLEFHREVLRNRLTVQETNCWNNLTSGNISITAEQLSTNAQQNGEGAIANLLDNNTSTYFHSCWSSGPAADHYIQVDLPNAIGDFCFYFYKRTQNNDNRPTDIIVSGSETTGEGAEYTEIEEIAEGLVTSSGFYISSALKGGTYKSIRFTVKDTNRGGGNGGLEKNHPYFTMSEFRLYTAPAALDAYREVLVNVYPTLLAELNAATTEEELVYIEQQLEEALGLQTTTVVPVKRASSLSKDKVYMIFNVAKNTQENKDMLGVMSANSTEGVKWESMKPSEFKTHDTKYLWKVTPNDDGSYKLTSYDDVQVNALGAVGTENVQIVNYADNPMKCYDGISAWLEDEKTLVKSYSVETDHNVWAIHNGTNGWNGDINGFKTATEAFEPFAFYEVVAYDAVKWMVYEQAQELLAKEGQVGYPKKDNATAAEALTQMKSLIAQDPNATENWSTTLQAQIEAYKNVNDIQMPENGKAYTITSVNINGVKRYMNYTEAGYDVVQVADGEELPETAVLICRKVDENQYVFTNLAGKYFMWRGSDAGNNDHKGYADAYDATNASSNTVLTVEKICVGGNVTGTQDALLGFMAMKGNRNDGSTPNYFVIKTAGGYDQAEAMFFNSNFTSALLIEEVPDYRNKISFTQLNDEDYWVATYSAPYPTVIPDDVTAYAVTSTNETDATTWSLQGDGTAIPENTGVLLAVQANEQPADVYMAPAADEVEKTLPTETNLLEATPYEVTDENNTTAFILASVNNVVGFYPANPGTIGSFRAWLDLSGVGGEVRSLSIKFGDEATGIDGVAQPMNGSGTVYDLSGRAVAKPVKGGFYIKNGVKFIQK